MVRSRRMLEIIERDGLIPRAAILGEKLLAGLRALRDEFPGAVRAVRGRGLMCAFDVASGRSEDRDRLIARLRDEEGVLFLPCGEASIRLRPALSVTPEELEFGLAALRRVLRDQPGSSVASDPRHSPIAAIRDSAPSLA
jgi:L-lysine 6-transaminase